MNADGSKFAGIGAILLSPTQMMLWVLYGSTFSPVAGYDRLLRELPEEVSAAMTCTSWPWIQLRTTNCKPDFQLNAYGCNPLRQLRTMVSGVYNGYKISSLGPARTPQKPWVSFLLTVPTKICHFGTSAQPREWRLVGHGIPTCVLASFNSWFYPRQFMETPKWNLVLTSANIVVFPARKPGAA